MGWSRKAEVEAGLGWSGRVGQRERKKVWFVEGKQEWRRDELKIGWKGGGMPFGGGEEGCG